MVKRENSSPDSSVFLDSRNGNGNGNGTHRSRALPDQEYNWKSGSLFTDPPLDGITSLIFPPNNSNYLMATSWDKHLYVYNLESNTLKVRLANKAPLLCSAFQDASIAYSGSTDNYIRRHDLNTSQSIGVGCHSKAVKCVAYSEDYSTVISAGWDKKLYLWDPKSKHTKAGGHDLGSDAVAMSVRGNKVSVAQKDRQIKSYDFRCLGRGAFSNRTSYLENQFRDIEIRPDGKGYCATSNAGQVTFEDFKANKENRFSSTVVNCHRRPSTADSTSFAYPVNSVVYHPESDMMFTGGSDGVVTYWDTKSNKVMGAFPDYPMSISNLAVSPNGQYLAVANCYLWERGPRNSDPSEIYLRDLGIDQDKFKLDLNLTTMD